MKISGHVLDGSFHEEVLVIPHGNKNIPFCARAIMDFDEFDKLCPEPQAPGRLTKDGFKKNFEDTSYLDMVNHYNQRRVAWMVVASLQDIDWDTVQRDDPSTWVNWRADMKSNGISEIVCNRIQNHVMGVNSLDEIKLEKARADFALGQGAVPSDTSTLTTEPQSTPSGAPANE
jgi:hypothetical protein